MSIPYLLEQEIGGVVVPKITVKKNVTRVSYRLVWSPHHHHTTRLQCLEIVPIFSFLIELNHNKWFDFVDFARSTPWWVRSNYWLYRLDRLFTTRSRSYISFDNHLFSIPLLEHRLVSRSEASRRLVAWKPPSPFLPSVPNVFSFGTPL